MDLNKYTELTGIVVSTSDEARVKANIRKTKSKLETLLGFSLKPKNLYTEKGKVQFEGYLPIDDLTELLPPDDEEGTYKLFHYDERDKYFHVDPFTNLYKVKLVVPSNDDEFITVLELDNVVGHRERGGFGRFIERHYEWFTWAWYATWRLRYSFNSPAGLQLAIEADWLDCYPDDIMYLWADMITYYSDPNYSVNGSLKSESVTGHSWSRGNAGGSKEGDLAPQDDPINKAILNRYAGPNGSVVRNPAR